MTFLPILILAVIQGLTEFLPVSSSGHLVLVHHLLGDAQNMWQDTLLLDMAVHVGTLLAVLLYFRTDVLDMLKGLPPLLTGKTENPNAKLNFNLLLASLPVIIAGLALYKFQPDFLRNIEIMAYATIIFGIALGAADRYAPKTKTVEKLTIRNALFIGFAQTLALIPGTSRSGITMTAGRLIGMNAQQSARFSLLLSIIAIGGAGALGALDLIQTENLTLGKDILLAIALSFLTGYASIALMMRWLERAGFMPFVIYRIILGTTLLAFIYSGAL